MPPDDLLSEPPAPASPPAAGAAGGGAPGDGKQPTGAPPTPAVAPGVVPPQHDKPPQGSPPADPLRPDPNKAFLATLPKDLQENASLGRYSSTESLARAYVNLERTLGSEKVPIPRDPNDQEAWDRYYVAGGRPPEPAGYSFDKPEKLPEGVTWDDNMEGWWRQAAFESGLSQRQAQKLVDQYRDRYVAQIDLGNKQIDSDLVAGRAVLQRDWGAEYEARRSLARAAFNAMPPDLQKAMKDTGLARMPSLIKYLHDVQKAQTGERVPVPPGDSAVTSPDAIRQRISAFRAQHAVALADASHPDHDRLLAEFTRMHSQLFPEAAA